MDARLDPALKIAEFLLQIKAVKLSPKKPFTWASGWKSPIYCDNRKTLSYPAIRTYIRQQFVHVINHEFGRPDMIAGVATGGIAHGAHHRRRTYQNLLRAIRRKGNGVSRRPVNSGVRVGCKRNRWGRDRPIAKRCIQ